MNGRIAFRHHVAAQVPLEMPRYYGATQKSAAGSDPRHKMDFGTRLSDYPQKECGPDRKSERVAFPKRNSRSRGWAKPPITRRSALTRAAISSNVAPTSWAPSRIDSNRAGMWRWFKTRQTSSPGSSCCSCLSPSTVTTTTLATVARRASRQTNHGWRPGSHPMR